MWEGEEEEEERGRRGAAGTNWLERRNISREAEREGSVGVNNKGWRDGWKQRGESCR